MQALAHAWASSPLRPRVPQNVSAAWGELLEGWAADSTLPLFVRRASAGRGSVVHHRTGRDLVPTDNSPAHWALGLALAGRVPSIDEIRQALSHDAIPVAMVLKRLERDGARYTCTRSDISLNDLGWKIGHIDGVGLGRTRLDSTSMETLIAHFRRFLRPGNMFVVPLQWAGLAELPEMIASLRALNAEAA